MEETEQTSVAIPKLIMQTWKTDQVPTKWLEGQRSVMETMKGWKYTLQTDDDNKAFCNTHFPQYADFYKSLPYGIQRADMIRYMWLYINGGLYMDLDYLVKAPLDELFASEGASTGGHCLFLVTSINSEKYITNSIMASTAKNPFWLAVLEECVKPLPWYIVSKDWRVLVQTGPGAVTRAYEKLDKITTEVTIIPNELVHPCTTCDSDAVCLAKTSSSYLKQLEGESWTSSLWKPFKLIYCWFKGQEPWVAWLVGFCLLSIFIMVVYKLLRR